MENVIRSQDNIRFKGWQKLLKKKYREKENRCLIEGDNLIEEAAYCGIVIHDVILKEDTAVRERTKAVLDRAERVTVLSEKLFKSLSQTEATQGAMAEITVPSYTLSDVKKGRGERGNVLILDRLQDPGNLGTIIRTADAAGFDGIICVKGTAELWSPKVMRSAAGSVFRVPVVYEDTAEAAMKTARDLGKKIAVTAFDEAEDMWDADFSEDTAIVIGNEARGVSEELMNAADIRIKIPMHGRIESLNAAMAAGILMYESIRKNRN